ncbi:MAG: eCIS core domain-containing protein, partial [Cyclobacteriaceae bacterium]
DSEARELNQQLGAQAFTQGRDIYFNSDKYHPETASGKRLLAHELTHVIQQKGKKKKGNK